MLKGVLIGCNLEKNRVNLELVFRQTKTVNQYGFDCNTKIVALIKLYIYIHFYKSSIMITYLCD